MPSVIIENVLNANLERQNITLKHSSDLKINGMDLLVLPGLIDPHVHFRIPGFPEKEDWQHAAKAALKGGYTTVFDMPNTNPPTTTLERLEDKFAIIDQQLAEVAIPLKYKLWFGADKNNFQEIARFKSDPNFSHKVAGIKVFMGSSTGELLMDDISSLHAIYALAKAHNLIIALHAEDELTIQNNLQLYKNSTNYADHSKIRSVEAAIVAINLVIELAKLYNVTSYILHISTQRELEIIREAKKQGIPIFAETCPHYLFLNDTYYQSLNGLAKVNPPLRSEVEQDYLWQAIADGLIDTVASDHAPHLLSEKQQVLCKCPSGMPGIETSLPLLLTAYKNGKIAIERIIEVLCHNPRKIFNLDTNSDLVFVDINNYRVLKNEDLCTKSQWSPFAGMSLTGFPKYIYTNSKFIDLNQI